jgi:ABC-type uncharacterized transport system substrate-binding protein
VINRRAFLGAIAGGLLAAPLAAEAEQAGKVYRIGLLSANAAGVPLTGAFRQGLRDLGYVEGRNLVIQARYAAGKIEQLPALASDLVALGVDVIVTAGTLATRVAKNSTNTIPVSATPWDRGW